MSARYLCLILMLAPGLNAQICLGLTTVASASGGGSVSLDLSLDSLSNTPPAGLQWNLQYPASAIRSLEVDDGPAATAAGKTVICAPNANGYTCVAVGANAKTIPNGVVAKVTAILAPDVSNAVIQVVNPLAASAEGYYMPISARDGMITAANVSPDRRLRPPLRKIAAIRCEPTQ
jgi:hypothetical protein